MRGQFVHRGRGQRITSQHTQSHRAFRQRVLFWGCFSARGPGPLIRIVGTMKTQNYVETLSEHMLPHLQECFPDGSGIFMQDNAPCHKSNVTMGYLHGHNINVIDWPPYSPDLNPIENLWAALKRKIQRVSRQTVTAVEQITMENWNNNMQTTCQELVASMPRRIAECIKNKGGPTGY